MLDSILLSAEQLKARLQEPGCKVFDVRYDLNNPQAGRASYLQSHVPGALFLDLESDLCALRTGRNGRHPLPKRADFAALMYSQGLTPGVDVVVYDGGNGAMAAHFWWMLRWLGHDAVALLDGGWPAWQASGGACEAGAHSPSMNESRVLQERGRAAGGTMPVFDAAAVLQNLSAPVFTVLDARAPERFSGAAEPLDPVAGHIPGALNRPFTQNLQADGRFKPASELAREFGALLGDKPPTEIVHQCGSGITACHNLFAMELAGLNGSGLYPGSWSEWCSDLSRPVARAGL